MYCQNKRVTEGARHGPVLLLLLVLGACAGGPAERQIKSASSAPSPPSSVSAKVTEPNPVDVQAQARRARFDRGIAALRDGNGVVAVEVFSKLAKQNPDSAAAHTNLGSAYMLQGDATAAMAQYQRAIEISPGLAIAHVRLGVLYRRAGDLTGAEAEYTAALNADPNNRLAHLNLGILYDIYLPKPAQALRHYESFQSLSDQPDEEVALWIADLKQRL